MNGAREPIFNAPWPPLLISASIMALYAVQSLFAFEPLAMRYGFSPTKLSQGDWASLLTPLFLHEGWLHAFSNAAFALAFGAPVARFLGRTAWPVIGFFLLYFGSGVLANLGYAAIHAGRDITLVGASGAVSGLMGAAARLIATRGERLGALNSPPVISMTLALLVANMLLAVFGSPGSGSPIAWEAHLAGFAAGLFGVGLITRLFGRGERLTD